MYKQNKKEAGKSRQWMQVGHAEQGMNGKAQGI
jgi:hypothetical protein